MKIIQDMNRYRLKYKSYDRILSVNNVYLIFGISTKGDYSI